MSDTIIGVIIGSGFSIVGLFITGLVNFFIEKVRKSHSEIQLLDNKKAEVYLALYKAYHKYFVERDSEQKKGIAKEIYVAILEVEIYGSKAINSLVDKIDEDCPDFDEQIERFKSAIRKELKVLK